MDQECKGTASLSEHCTLGGWVRLRLLAAAGWQAAVPLTGWAGPRPGAAWHPSSAPAKKKWWHSGSCWVGSRERAAACVGMQRRSEGRLVAVPTLTPNPASLADSPRRCTTPRSWCGRCPRCLQGGAAKVSEQQTRRDDGGAAGRAGGLVCRLLGRYGPSHLCTN